MNGIAKKRCKRPTRDIWRRAEFDKAVVQRDDRLTLTLPLTSNLPTTVWSGCVVTRRDLGPRVLVAAPRPWLWVDGSFGKEASQQRNPVCLASGTNQNDKNT